MATLQPQNEPPSMPLRAIARTTAGTMSKTAATIQLRIRALCDNSGVSRA